MCCVEHTKGTISLYAHDLMCCVFVRPQVTFSYPGAAKPQLEQVTCSCRMSSRVAILGEQIVEGGVEVAGCVAGEGRGLRNG